MAPVTCPYVWAAALFLPVVGTYPSSSPLLVLTIFLVVLWLMTLTLLVLSPAAHYTGDAKGCWQYADNPDYPSFSITVILPGGFTEPIPHLSVHTSNVTLGGTTCPHRQASSILDLLSNKALDWANLAWNSDFALRNFTTLWPRSSGPNCDVVYTPTLCPMMTFFSAMYKPYYWMAPIGGLFCSAKLEL